MADYIVCQKKRNTPRIDVRICEKKCPLKEACEAYKAYLRQTFDHRQIPVSPETPPLVAAAS